MSPQSSDQRHWLRHARLRDAAQLADSGRTGAAIDLLRTHLKQRPRDGHALHLLAALVGRQGRPREALELWTRAVEAAPDFSVARRAYAKALLDAGRPGHALLHIEQLLAVEPLNPEWRALQACALEALDEYAGAVAICRELVHEQPQDTEYWTIYARLLRAQGRYDDSIAACRTVIALEPRLGNAWWSLADIKTFRFDDTDIATMEGLAQKGLNVAPGERACLHFALGKAYGDRKNYARSFEHYAKGNAVQRLTLDHDPDILTTYVARATKIFTPEFFARFAGSGSASRAPIFIVGMMRSGSTLVEQILASHSKIEGTRELAELAMLSQELQASGQERGCGYPEVLEQFGSELTQQTAQRYLDAANVHRKLGRDYFIDKMGANFAHVGLLQLLFPNAKIVDVRRHPLACGFSIFAQYFPKGQNNAWRLTDIGRHYRDYVALMEHFDRVLPGRVHRLHYENLVATPEAEIRRLLEYLELPFELACLEFHRTERSIATVSAEQVRRPLYQDAVGHWRNYEQWLGPLKSALGPALETYCASLAAAAAPSAGGGSG